MEKRDERCAPDSNSSISVTIQKWTQVRTNFSFFTMSDTITSQNFDLTTSITLFFMPSLLSYTFLCFMKQLAIHASVHVCTGPCSPQSQFPILSMWFIPATQIQRLSRYRCAGNLSWPDTLLRPSIYDIKIKLLSTERNYLHTLYDHRMVLRRSSH